MLKFGVRRSAILRERPAATEMSCCARNVSFCVETDFSRRLVKATHFCSSHRSKYLHFSPAAVSGRTHAPQVRSAGNADHGQCEPLRRFMTVVDLSAFSPSGRKSIVRPSLKRDILPYCLSMTPHG